MVCLVGGAGVWHELYSYVALVYPTTNLCGTYSVLLLTFKGMESNQTERACTREMCNGAYCKLYVSFLNNRTKLGGACKLEICTYYAVLLL